MRRMVGKNLDVAVLMDFYGSMLTPKQRDAIDLYYNQDLSLSEIAEHENISRQGVRDSIKRGETFLFELEDKLRMVDTYLDVMKLLQELRYTAERISRENETERRPEAIADDSARLLSLIDDYVKKSM